MVKKFLLFITLASLASAEISIYTAGCNDIHKNKTTLQSERVKGVINGVELYSYNIMHKLGVKTYDTNIKEKSVCKMYSKIMSLHQNIDKLSLVSEITKGYVLEKHGYTKKEIMANVIILKK